jgi:beta-glucosidase
MTTAEKIGQLQNDAPPVERLGIAAYNYWSEGLHGVLTDAATSFPTPIALGASWDPDLVQRVATAISDEARGIHLRDGKGLTYWSPVINMLRDPRWGRYDESYSEDPLLMSRLGVAFVRGLQGEDPKYLKTVATPKHFALNNSEYNRHDGSSDADDRLLFEYYLPAFEATVSEGKAQSVMAAYNRVNGVPASANPWLLSDLLRDTWGFDGYVVSDCDAVADIVNGHHWTKTLAEASAKALVAGTDLNCGTSYPSALGVALDEDLIAESDLDRALTRVLRARVLLGEFEPQESAPYRALSTDVIESVEHRTLAYEAAKASIVLLKNEGNLLPLDRSQLKSIAVIGPHGDSVTLGSYSGNPTHRVSALSALRERLSSEPAVEVSYAEGASVTGQGDPSAIAAAAELAQKADVALVFVGTDLNVFREEMDRADWALPGAQQELVAQVRAANPKTIVVLVTGGPLGIDWAQANVPAILTTFYNGQEQGRAIADVLLGDYNPGGKLSTTWYKNDAVLPPIGDYDLRKGRTYLYYGEEPLYPFGFGLSYTQFSYSHLAVSPAAVSASEPATVTVDVTNSGSRSGDEIVQLYVRQRDSDPKAPIQQLRGFTRLHLESGEAKTATFSIGVKDLSHYDQTVRAFRTEAGEYEIRVGASSSDIRQTATLRVIEGSIVENEGGGGGAGGTGADSGGTSSDVTAPSKQKHGGSGCDCTLPSGSRHFGDGWTALLALVGWSMVRAARRRGAVSSRSR